MSGQWAGSTRRDRLPSNWTTELVPYVLDRDGYACQIRTPGRCIGTATDVDHKQRGDDHHPNNLQAACQPCHGLKSSQEGNAARPRQGRPRERPPGLL